MNKEKMSNVETNKSTENEKGVEIQNNNTTKQAKAKKISKCIVIVSLVLAIGYILGSSAYQVYQDYKQYKIEQNVE